MLGTENTLGVSVGVTQTAEELLQVGLVRVWVPVQAEEINGRPIGRGDRRKTSGKRGPEGVLVGI